MSKKIGQLSFFVGLLLLVVVQVWPGRHLSENIAAIGFITILMPYLWAIITNWFERAPFRVIFAYQLYMVVGVVLFNEALYFGSVQTLIPGLQVVFRWLLFILITCEVVMSTNVFIEIVASLYANIVTNILGSIQSTSHDLFRSVTIVWIVTFGIGLVLALQTGSVLYVVGMALLLLYAVTAYDLHDQGAEEEMVIEKLCLMLSVTIWVVTINLLLSYPYFLAFPLLTAVQIIVIFIELLFGLWLALTLLPKASAQSHT